jgi:hypothetical protein
MNTTSQSDLFAPTRATDPETSREAAATVDVRKSQAQVINLFRRFGPMTDAELLEAAERLNVIQSPSGLRTRRSELVSRDVLYFTGTFKRLGTGRRARVWAIKEAA